MQNIRTMESTGEVTSIVRAIHKETKASTRPSKNRRAIHTYILLQREAAVNNCYNCSSHKANSYLSKQTPNLLNSYLFLNLMLDPINTRFTNRLVTSRALNLSDSRVKLLHCFQ